MQTGASAANFVSDIDYDVLMILSGWPLSYQEVNRRGRLDLPWFRLTTYG